MGRGLLFLMLQLGISIGVTAIGIWAIARPSKLQAFINQNFALLPAVGAGIADRADADARGRCRPDLLRHHPRIRVQR